MARWHSSESTNLSPRQPRFDSFFITILPISSINSLINYLLTMMTIPSVLYLQPSYHVHYCNIFSSLFVYNSCFTTTLLLLLSFQPTLTNFPLTFLFYIIYVLICKHVIPYYPLYHNKTMGAVVLSCDIITPCTITRV